MSNLYRYLKHSVVNRTVLMFSVIVLLSSSLTAQSPYRTTAGKELIFGGFGIGALGTGTYLRHQITLFTPEELERLDEHNVNALDRYAVSMLSPEADRTSDHLVNAVQTLPLLFLAGKQTRRHFGQIAIMYGETMMITAGLTTITKYAIRRPRPYVYNSEYALSGIQTINAQASFVSGHTSTAAAATFFVAKVYSDFYPDSEWKPVIWTAAAIVPAVTGYLRVRAGKHYPTDVIAGYALGAAVGVFVPHLHLNRGSRKQEISLVAMPNGLNFQMNF